MIDCAASCEQGPPADCVRDCVWAEGRRPGTMDETFAHAKRQLVAAVCSAVAEGWLRVGDIAWRGVDRWGYRSVAGRVAHLTYRQAVTWATWAARARYGTP